MRKPVAEGAAGIAGGGIPIRIRMDRRLAHQRGQRQSAGMDRSAIAGNGAEPAPGTGVWPLGCDFFTTGEMMKKLFVMIASVAILSGCGDSKTADVSPPSKTPDHHYAMKDGDEYGYQQGISENDLKSGQHAKSLLMIRYLGQRNGVYQTYMNLNDVGSAVMECTNPCQFLKTMTFVGNTFVSKDRIPVAPGILGQEIMEDAINGKLEQYVQEKNGKRFSLWFDEKSGVKRTEIK